MIVVDQASPVPPFEQVRTQYARLIASGDLAPGTRLPTVRRLAADLSLAPNTVARAYRELEAAGLVETRGRAGTTVSAAGNRAHGAAVTAAHEYAARVRALGVQLDDALDIVRAVLTADPDMPAERPRPAQG